MQMGWAKAGLRLDSCIGGIPREKADRPSPGVYDTCAYLYIYLSVRA